MKKALPGKPLTVLFFRHTLLGRGGDKMIVAQANRLVSRGHRVIIMTSLIATHFVLDERVKVELTGSISVVATMMNLCRMAFSFDLMIVDIVPLTVLAAIRFGRKRIVYYCQDWDVSYYQKKSFRLLIRSLYWFERVFLRVPIVVVADHLLDKVGRRGVGRTFVVENGIDPIIFNATLRKRSAFSSHELPTVLIFLRDDFRKGSDLSLKLVKRLAVAYPEGFKIISVGEACQEMIPGIEWDDQGTVDEDRLNHLLNCCDLFLYPSRHEGFSLMALEAFSCRCLLLTTVAVSFATDGQNALVAAVEDEQGLYDRLCSLMDARIDVEKLVDNANNFSASHSVSACSEQFACIIETILE